MITFEWTKDSEAVKAILTDPKSYIRMVNDTAPAREDLQINAAGPFGYVLAREYGKPVAVFILITEAPAVEDIHFCFSSYAWGRTRQICAAFMEWVWANTSIMELHGSVPSYNKLALKLAISSGFQKAHIKPGGMKHGRPFDLIETVAWRPDALL